MFAQRDGAEPDTGMSRPLSGRLLLVTLAPLFAGAICAEIVGAHAGRERQAVVLGIIYAFFAVAALVAFAGLGILALIWGLDRADARMARQARHLGIAHLVPPLLLWMGITVALAYGQLALAKLTHATWPAEDLATWGIVASASPPLAVYVLAWTRKALHLPGSQDH